MVDNVGLEKRASIAAQAAAQAVREGRTFTFGPSDPLPAVDDDAAATSEVKAVSRGNSKAFLENLDGIANGRVRVIP